MIKNLLSHEELFPILDGLSVKLDNLMGKASVIEWALDIPKEDAVEIVEK